MCEFLIRKHSRRGELVLDLCGCTESLTLDQQRQQSGQSATLRRKFACAVNANSNHRKMCGKYGFASRQDGVAGVDLE
jgi:hypothetical protein